MTRRCILHVGLHKTGSSSIQETLYRNASLRGAHYLDLGEANASGMVKLLFGGAEQASQTPLARQQGDEAARDLARKRLDRALAEVGPADTVIFSAEALSRLSIHGLQALQAALAPQFQSIEVVGYVRDMPGFMASAFQQRVKGGTGHFAPRLLYPHYRAHLEKLDQVFGREKVLLWPFDPAAMPEGCVVRDFCQRLGLELEASTIRRVNQGMRRDALCLLYLDRKFNRQRKEAGWRRADAALQRQLQRLPGDKVVWADTVLDEMRRRYRADLDWACARLGADLSGVGPARPGGLAREPDLWSPSPSAVAALAEWTGRAPPAPMAAPARQKTLRWSRRLLRARPRASGLRR